MCGKDDVGLHVVLRGVGGDGAVDPGADGGLLHCLWPERQVLSWLLLTWPSLECWWRWRGPYRPSGLVVLLLSAGAPEREEVEDGPLLLHWLAGLDGLDGRPLLVGRFEGRSGTGGDQGLGLTQRKHAGELAGILLLHHLLRPVHPVGGLHLGDLLVAGQVNSVDIVIKLLGDIGEVRRLLKDIIIRWIRRRLFF